MPDQYDMEPGTFLNWSEMFLSCVMSLYRKWRLILTTLQKKDAPWNQEDIARIQDAL